MVQWSCVLLHDTCIRVYVYVYLAAVVATEASTTGEGPLQLDVGDIGASVIEHLVAGVSAQCELHALYTCMYARIHCVLEILMCVRTYVRTCIDLYVYVRMYAYMYVCMYIHIHKYIRFVSLSQVVQCYTVTMIHYGKVFLKIT